MNEEYNQYPENKSRFNYKIITIILLCIIILVSGYFGLSYMNNITYTNGYEAGALDAQIYVAQLQTENSILFYLNETNGINTIKLDDLCGK